MRSPVSGWGFLLAIVAALPQVPVHASAPTAFNYQGVARNADGTPVSNSAVTVRLSIRSTTPIGTVIYRETHPVVTTDAGQFAVTVGAGTQVSAGAAFSDLSWIDSFARFLQTELSISGGAFVDMGTTQLLSVPYALEANHAVSANGLTNTKLVPLATAAIDSQAVSPDSTTADVTITSQSGNALFLLPGSVTATWDEENNWYVVGVSGHDLRGNNCVVLVSPLINGDPRRIQSTGFIVTGGENGKVTVKFSRLRSTTVGSEIQFERVKCAFFIAIYKMAP